MFDVWDGKAEVPTSQPPFLPHLLQVNFLWRVQQAHRSLTGTIDTARRRPSRHSSMTRIFVILLILIGYSLFVWRLRVAWKYERRAWPGGVTGVVMALAFALLLATLPLAVLIAIGQQTRWSLLPIFPPLR